MSSQQDLGSGPSSEHGHFSTQPSTSRHCGHTTQQIGQERQPIQQETCMEDVMQNITRSVQELEGHQEEYKTGTKKIKSVASKRKTRPTASSTITSAQSTSQVSTDTEGDTGQLQATTTKQTTSSKGSLSMMA